MNTLKLREFSEEQMRLGFPISSIAALQQAADTIDKLRAHCRQQRKELRRLNDALARRRKVDDVTIADRMEARLVALDIRLAAIARFVGCINTMRNDANTEAALGAPRTVVAS